MQREIGREFRCLQRLIHQKMEQFRQENGDDLTFVQVQTLHYLQDHEDVYQKDIEKVLNVRRSTATEILNVLERDGYIERHSVASDKRLKKLVLTSKARELRERMHLNIVRMEDLLRQNLSEEEILLFFKIVDQMKDNLKEEKHD